MGIRAWHRFVFAFVPCLLVTAAVAADYQTARRLGPPTPPPDVEVSDLPAPAEIIIAPGYVPASDYYAGVPACDVPGTIIYPSCEAPSAPVCDIPMNCCDCCSLWTVRAGAVFLRRNSGPVIPIATGNPSYSTADLAFGFEAGPAVSFIRHGFLNTCWDLEVNYFGSYSNASATTPDLTILQTTPPGFVFGGVLSATTTYDSNLHSTEVNLRRQWNDWLTVLGGFRWIELSDDLNTDVGNGLATIDYDVNNHLYGAQIGVVACLFERGAFHLEGHAKAGVFGNSADLEVTTVNALGALPQFSISGNETVFVGDLALTGVYNLNDRWSLRGGYQLLWIDGVAVAPTQLANVDITTGAGDLNTSTTAFYHGFTAGAEFRF